MVRSLALVLLAVAVLLVLTWRPQPDAVKVVDPTPVLVQARIEAPYPVLYPEGLDDSGAPPAPAGKSLKRPARTPPGMWGS